MSRAGDWQPSATRAQLTARAELLRRTREFFAALRVLEVDTPMVVNAAVSDVHIDSATVGLATRRVTHETGAPPPMNPPPPPKKPPPP